MPTVPYLYEVNGKLVTGNGALIPICSYQTFLIAKFECVNKSLSPIFEFFNEIVFKDSADFQHRKVALKIRIMLYLTFNTK